MAVRIKVGTFAQEAPPNCTLTPRGLVQRNVIPGYSHLWLVSDETKQAYSGDDLLSPGDYRILMRDFKQSSSQADRYEVLSKYLPLPEALQEVVNSYLPYYAPVTILEPSKFGLCCWPKFPIQRASIDQPSQLGFPCCCIDPYEDNESNECLFYISTRALVLGPLAVLLFAIISVILAAGGQCCENYTPGDWAMRFLPCWVVYSAVYSLYFVYAWSDQTYLQGDYDEGTEWRAVTSRFFAWLVVLVHLLDSQLDFVM